ncbi:MAG TPA: sugar ABC transporter substrate-binding protein [Pseudolysinimonas sp.]|nr:sugar ABC transporter substrate-binding protein [Pseudolysinimonas sp.]
MSYTHKSKIAGVTAALAITALTLVGCAGSSTDDPAGGPVKGIAFLAGSPDATYVVAEREGITETAKAAGYKVDSFSADYDPARQQSQCDTAISSGKYSGIIIIPVSGPTAVPCVTQAAAAGIKVASLDVQVGPKLGATGIQTKGIVAQIYADQNTLVAEQAKLVLKACKDAAKCVIGAVTGDPAYPDQAVARQAWRDQVAKHPSLEIAGEVEGGFSNADGGISATQSLLQTAPEINVIVVDDDETATGVVAELARQGKSDTVQVIGTGGTAAALERITKGTQFATIAYIPKESAIRVTKMLLTAIGGGKIATPSLDLTAVTKDGVAVTRSNVSSFLPGY